VLSDFDEIKIGLRVLPLLPLVHSPSLTIGVIDWQVSPTRSTASACRRA
jgi:hypothetical protein